MTSLRDEQAKLSTASLVILAAAVITGTLYLTQAVMIPFVLAIFIASIVAPIVDFQVLRIQFPLSVAVSVALLFVLVIIGVFGLMVIYAGQQIAATSSQYIKNIDTISDNFSTWTQSLLTHWIHKETAEQLVSDGTNKVIEEFRGIVPQLLGRTFGTTISLVTTFFLVTIFVIFLLAGRNPYVIRQGMHAEIDQKIRSYISTKVFLSALTGVLVWISLWLFDLKLAGVFALLVFLLNFIPSIGSVIATLLPIPVAVAQWENPWQVAAVVAIPGAIQLVIGNVLEPKLMGNEMKLHPVVILLALSFWGLLWGPIGMLLATPITAMLRIVLMRFETVRPVGELLAGKLPEDRPTAFGNRS